MCNLVMASSGLNPNGTAQILLDWEPLVELDVASPRALRVAEILQRDIRQCAIGRGAALTIVVAMIVVL